MTNISRETIRNTMLLSGGDIAVTADKLGITKSHLITRLRYLTDDKGWDTPPPPVEDVYSIEELIERRVLESQRRKALEEENQLIQINLLDPGPIGILHFGDPHVDDPGCDFEKLRDHVRLVKRTDGLYCGNVGDSTNNWTGRLAKLHANQGTTAREAWRLVEWLVGELSGKWLYLIGGNHDCWSGPGDPLQWICKSADALYRPSEVRLDIHLRGGVQFTVNGRHDFRGNSQWNPAHGAMKAASLGIKDDIMICGHKHISGYGVRLNEVTGRVTHCIQVASYKIWDDFAKEKGFRQQHISPSVVTVIDPRKVNEPGFITVFLDVEAGAFYLTKLRQAAVQRLRH